MLRYTTSDRMFAAILGVVVFFVTLLGGGDLLAAAQGRPNILFIMSDDHCARAVGAYGLRLAKLDPTPNLDKLARNGVIFDNVFCTNSICTPSRASVLTGQYPTQIKGQKVKPPAGKSLLPIFHGKQREPHDALFFQFSAAKAVRQGDWKLVKLGKSPWELYNLKTDRTELNNLADKHPDRVEKMTQLWQDWMTSCKQKP